MKTQKRHQKFDYTAIADRHRTGSWSDYIHPTVIIIIIIYSGYNMITWHCHSEQHIYI